MARARKFAALCTAVLLMAAFNIAALAADFDGLPAGEYAVEASLSCYVSAMGGVEFGAPLLKKTTLIVDDSGNGFLRLSLSKSSVTIYGITCDTFADISPTYQTDDRGVLSGTLGIYNAAGTLNTAGVTHTLSGDTALNASNEAVRYVSSITLPLDRKSGEYRVSLYINSNVMGVQFCEKNDKATAATYPAVLTVNWDKLDVGSPGQAPPSPAPAGNTETPNETPGVEPSGNSGATSGGEEPDSPNDPTNGGSGAAIGNETSNGENDGLNNGAAGNETPDTEPGDSSGSEIVVEEDGLAIHYANGVSAPGSGSDEPTYTAYLNVNMMILIAVCAGVLIAAGIILLISAKKSKPGKEAAAS